MTTIATSALLWLADAWEAAIDGAARRDDAATFSGIVGDLAHRQSGGYHISREDQPAWNYSVSQCPEDREGGADWAAAIDMNMRPEWMATVTSRLIASADDPDDPRLNKWREFYGTVNGRTVVGRDTQFGEVVSSDDSHLWHVHLSVLRKYADDLGAMRDVLSVITGQTYLEGGDDVGSITDPLQRAELGNAEHYLQAIINLADPVPGGVSNTQTSNPNHPAKFVQAFKELAANVKDIKARPDAVVAVDQDQVNAAVSAALADPATADALATRVADLLAARLQD